MHRIPIIPAAFAGLLLLASIPLVLIPATAAAEEIEFCVRNDGLFQARLGVVYEIPGRGIPRDYAGTGFSMGGKRCFSVPQTAENLRVRVDAEVKSGRWNTLCEYRYVKVEEAANFALVTEGSKFDPTCKRVPQTP